MPKRRGQTIKGSVEKIKFIREKLRASQSQLAEKLGVATNTVARWERGDLEPPRIAEMAAEYLLTKEGKRGSSRKSTSRNPGRRDQ